MRYGAAAAEQPSGSYPEVSLPQGTCQATKQAYFTSFTASLARRERERGGGERSVGCSYVTFVACVVYWILQFVFMRFIIPAAMGMKTGNTGNTVQALYALEINEAVHLTLN